MTKTILTEGALKRAIELRDKYDGPNRETYVAELDRFIAEFREKHGTEIELGEALELLRHLERQFGRQ